VRLSKRRPSWRARRGVLLALLIPWPALAWNAAGHRLVACLAWDQLDQARRVELSQLLREHPDYARWRKRATTGDVDRQVFIEASTWPDEIRQDRRFYDKGIDPPAPTMAGFPDMERHRDWHYVNRPLPAAAEARQAARGAPVAGALDRQLVALAQTLGSPGAPRGERSYALPWLIHLTGDAHQPLHASVKLDAVGGEDGGGNQLMITNPFTARRNTTSLHAFWDDLPGPVWLRGDRLDAACHALAATYPRPPPSTSTQWLAESWQIAHEGAYPPAGDDPPTISAEFYESARNIANRRIAQAGYRLADLLRELLAKSR